MSYAAKSTRKVLYFVVKLQITQTKRNSEHKYHPKDSRIGCLLEVGTAMEVWLDLINSFLRIHGDRHPSDRAET